MGRANPQIFCSSGLEGTVVCMRDLLVFISVNKLFVCVCVCVFGALVVCEGALSCRCGGLLQQER